METAQLDTNGPIDWADNARVASTLSVWENVEALRTFVFNGVHGQFFRRGSEWFLPTQMPRLVLWHVDVGTRPTMADAAIRMKHLAANGSSEFAFGFDEPADKGNRLNGTKTTSG